MGVSLDAILLYGIPLEDDIDYDDIDTVLPLKDNRVKLYRHCCSEACMYFLVPKEIKVSRASRGYPENITDKDLKLKPEYDKILREVCIEHNYIPAGEPGWYLCSYMG